MQFIPHRKNITSATKINWLMLFEKIIAVYCGNQREHTDAFCSFIGLKQVVHIEPLDLNV
jgi:hypothetical protein